MTTERKLHPLHTPEAIALYMQTTGMYYPTERRTGRTTIIALECIAHAMQNPHQWYCVRDHHNTEAAARGLVSLIQQTVQRLGLKHFLFRHNAVCFGQSNELTSEYPHAQK